MMFLSSDDKPQSERFSKKFPDVTNSLELFPGAWKFDFEKMSRAEIEERILRDGRPRFCAGQFKNFSRMSILELGPSDGYNTVGLEWAGAANVTAIESNVDAYMRCLVLKNYFNLRAQFLLGDFVPFIAEEIYYDLIYASGILYHLTDPGNFLAQCAQKCRNLFIWTFIITPEVWTHSYESKWFKENETTKAQVLGHKITYYRRYYEPAIVGGKKFAGGINEYACWMSYEDIQKIIGACGFKIDRLVPDEFKGIKAINILASRV